MPHGLLNLNRDEIHLWRADLDREGMKALPALEWSLSRDELEKARGFRSERDRNRYVVAHGALRTILARYLTTTPGEPVFRYGPKGKPELAHGVVHFSMSHSHDLFLCAFSTSGVGVDVERVRPGVEQDLAEYLSPTARQSLDALTRAAQRRALFQGWTRMEAYSKARGEGLESGLEIFELFLREHPRGWCLHDFSPRRGYVGTLATRRRKRSLRYWEWQAGDMADMTQTGASQV
jgi:4'-phosphopantetheinyl transferase